MSRVIKADVHEFDIGGGPACKNYRWRFSLQLASKKGQKIKGGAFLWTLLPNSFLALLFFLPPSSRDALAHFHSDTALKHVVVFLKNLKEMI